MEERHVLVVEIDARRGTRHRAIDRRNQRKVVFASALSDQVESPDRKEFAPIQKLGKHVLVGKAGPLFRDML
jgi:hypothetical protein